MTFRTPRAPVSDRFNKLPPEIIDIIASCLPDIPTILNFTKATSWLRAVNKANRITDRAFDREMQKIKAKMKARDARRGTLGDWRLVVQSDPVSALELLELKEQDMHDRMELFHLDSLRMDECIKDGQRLLLRHEALIAEPRAVSVQINARQDRRLRMNRLMP